MDPVDRKCLSKPCGKDHCVIHNIIAESQHVPEANHSVCQDPVKEIGRLAEFLGVDPSVADKVAEKTNFSVMKEFKIMTDSLEVRDFFDNNKVNANLFREGD